MSDQLALFDSPPSRTDKYTLFLAIQPDLETARQIHRMANELRTVQGLGGQLRPVDHLHISLHSFGSHSVVPASLVAEIDRACKNIADLTSPFEVRFDQVLRFQGSGAVVLGQNKNANLALDRFHAALGRTLTLHAVRAQGHKNFTPHLTMQYTRESFSPESIAPVQWHVGEFVLIRSEVGATKYTHLGRWRLSGTDRL